MMLRIANSELQRMVERDTLTPLYNRRYFINAVNDRLKRLGRYGTRSILVFADVDGLKRITDKHAHNAGDYVLIPIARRLAENRSEHRRLGIECVRPSISICSST